jgi:dCMP deaminase
MIPHQRPSWDDYFVSIAYDVSTRANCLRRHVGAVIVVERRIISTGYNGTPFGVTNCDLGGCPRCEDEAYGRMEGNEWCICVHAEQNAIALAARQGTATAAACLYTTSQPCFNCLKEVIQAGIVEVIFAQPFTLSNQGYEQVYNDLIRGSGLLLRQYESSPAKSYL